MTVRAHTNYRRTVKCPCGARQSWVTGKLDELARAVVVGCRCSVCGRRLVDREPMVKGRYRARFAFVEAT